MTEDGATALHAERLLLEHQQALYRRTDRLFAGLMVLQWLAVLAAAHWVTPRTWAGTDGRAHPLIWDALVLGGLVTLLPVALALWRPGRDLTRHVIAIGQLVMSGLLIHFTGGRMETHFHIFGSLAFLAFYRDWRVLVTASVVTAADHYLRGVFWPQSLYGIATAEPWRWLEHTGWVVFEDTFLIISCVQSTREMRDIAQRQARHEAGEERLREREAALKRANSVLRAQQEASIDGILIVDEDRRVVSFNRRFRELLCIPEDLIEDGDDHAVLRHSVAQMRDPDECLRKVQYLYEHSQETSHDEQHMKDGRIFDGYSGPVVGENGQNFGRIWHMRDITERVRAEEALRRAHDDLESRVQERTAALARAGHQNQALLDAAGEGIFGLDADGLTTFVNPVAAQTLGYTSDELRCRPMHTLLHHTRPDGTHYPREECPIYAALRDGDVHRVEDEVFWRKDGTAFPVDYISTPVREDGRVVGAVVVFRDITERLRAAAALDESRRMLQLVMDSIPQAIFWKDTDSVYQGCNQVFADAAGVTRPEEVVGRVDYGLAWDAGQADQFRADDRQVMDSNTPRYQIIEPQRQASGRTVWLETNKIPLHDAGGRVTGILGTFQDITERRNAEAQIAQLNAQLEQRLDSIVALNLELSQAYDATIAGWSRALDLRDHETEGHSLRVTHLTLQLAAAFGIAGDARTHIQRGALLHDIGKMGVPDAILNKPGPLTDDERTVMCLHPTFAYEMLSGIPFVHPALDIPYCHHERWDGTGYPRGLAGEQIPFAARLFAVVDVWDALRSDRPYRRAWPVEKTRAHIASLSGTHFDPQAVDVFLRQILPEIPDHAAPPAALLRAA